MLKKDLSGGPGVGSLFADSGATGSIPGPRGPHMPRGKQACAPQLLEASPRAALCKKRNPRDEKLTHCN